MSFNVSAWSIRNPIPALMLFVMLTFAGVVAFKQMKVQQFPDMELPMVSVSASLPGASPAQLESDVARKLEDSLATVQGLKHITTSVQDGLVSITAEFRLEKPVQEAVDDVRSAVQRVRSDMPSDLRDPVVTKVEMSGSPVLAFTIDSDRMDAAELSWFVDNTVSRRLLAVPGVGGVSRVGGVTRQVHVDLDPARLQALGATASDISNQLRSVQVESAGGRFDLSGGEQPVRTLATVQSADELNALQITLSDGRRIRLDQVAQIRDTQAEPRQSAFYDGKSVVAFEVQRSRGASEVEVGAGVHAALEKLKAERPDVQVAEAFNFVKPVQEEYDGSMKLLYEGAFLAVVVVWLFLRDGRATIVSAVALPMSIIPAFVGMHWLGFSVNVITLLAMSLVVGVLVDDAIVEVENIVRHLRMGKTPYQAAMEAADEIGLAVVATTFTLIAVFLPTAFMSGVAGQFFKQFGWTASLAVFASLVVARVLTPMMAAYLLKPLADEEKEPRWLSIYMRMARWSLKHRVITLGAALAFFAGSLALIPLLPTGFMPPDDNSQTQVYLTLPPGTKLSQSEAMAEAARQRLMQMPNVRHVYTTVGGGAAGSNVMAGAQVAETRKATLTVRLDERGERPKKTVLEQHIREALADLPGVRISVGLGHGMQKYVLALSGDDPHALNTAAAAFERELRQVPGLGNTISTAALVRPEIAVRPDFARAADLGVTSMAIANTLRVATQGDFDQNLPKLNLAQRQVPIVVKLQDEARQDLAQLERLMVPGARGPVPLHQVASVGVEGGPAMISRYDRQRNINFEIQLGSLTMGEAQKAVHDLPSAQQLPAGVQLKGVGDAEAMAELFESFGLAMLTGVLCIYVVLVLLFKDFLQPITILCALPLAVGGAFVALLLGKMDLSMPTLIGLIMLMGIATKNSILLVEYAIVARRDQGMSRFEAVMDACHKRARPIIMTTLAMGAGMLPIAAGWGAADPSFRSPMAVAVIGGLITSTFLSLLVVPAVYTFVDDVESGIKRLFGRGHAKHHTGNPAGETHAI